MKEKVKLTIGMGLLTVCQWMKLYVLFLFISLLAFTGCSGDEMYSDRVPGSTDGLWLKMGDNSVVPTSDIDAYDVSSHTIFLKKKAPYLEKVGYDGGVMSVHVGKEEIYKCSFHSAFLSYMPAGAFIYSPPFYKEDIIRISFLQMLNEKHEPMVTDPRSDKRIIEALKKYRQYHEGLHFEIKSCHYSKDNLVLNIELYNPDSYNYYYLDIKKMGFGLFHYFTNGPTFWDVKYTQTYTHKETVVHPAPWDSWKIEWLSLIKRGERKSISIVYQQFDRMPSGKYRMNFAYPGLINGLSQKDLILKDGRIWTGGVSIDKEVVIP